MRHPVCVTIVTNYSQCRLCFNTKRKIIYVESLDLRGVWLRNSNRDSFVSGIRKLRHLRKLSIPYVANDDLLAALAMNCPELRHLDLAGASEVTAEGAEQLYRVVIMDFRPDSQLNGSLSSIIRITPLKEHQKCLNSWWRIQLDYPLQGTVHADAQQPGLPEPGRSEREALADRNRSRSDFEPGMSSLVVFTGSDHITFGQLMENLP